MSAMQGSPEGRCEAPSIRDGVDSYLDLAALDEIAEPEFAADARAAAAGGRWKTMTLISDYLRAAQQAEQSRAQARLKAQQEALASSSLQDCPDQYPEQSLLFLSKANPARRAAILITTHPSYERFTLLLIVASCTTLALDSTRADFTSTRMGRILQGLEFGWAGIMSLELVLRVVARGLIAHPKAFLRSGWGVLDLVVVVLGFLNLLPGTNNLTAVRAFRVLRPLRAISRLPKLKVLVVTLLTALPMLSYVIVLCALVYLAYGIVGVQLFQGALRNRCAYADFSAASIIGDAAGSGVGGQVRLGNVSFVVPLEEQDTTCSGPQVRSDYWLRFGGSYVPASPRRGAGRQCPAGMYCTQYGNPNNGFTHYDQILYAWLTIFQCITEEGWTDAMYYTQDAVSYWVWPYYVSMIILCSIFLMNLALVVLYVQFTKSDAAVRHQMLLDEAAGKGKNGRQRQPGQGSESDDEGEEEEGEAGKQAQQLQHKPGVLQLPSFAPAGPTATASTWQRLRRLLHTAARSRWLHVTSVTLIIANTLTMCINWYGMPERLDDILNDVNMGLTAYFVLELLIRVVGVGPRRHFRDGMNIFDALVVVASVVEVVLDLNPSTSGVAPLSVLRTLRFLRLVRLLHNWHELQNVVQTLLKSVVSVAWMSVLMLLFLVIAALLGVQLFGYKFQFCDHVDGAEPRCPMGQRVWGDCPQHFQCYVPCADVGQWLSVPGSKYGGQAYCQRWCDGDTGSCEQLAAVGKPDVSQSNFDNFGWALLTVFQVITCENWNNVMYDGMRANGPVASLYFIGVVVIGNYIVLNLFIAILLENFASNLDLTHGADGGEPDEGEIKQSESFRRQLAEADRSWFKAMFGHGGQVYPSREASMDGSMYSGYSGVTAGGGSESPLPGEAGRNQHLYDEFTRSAPSYFHGQLMMAETLQAEHLKERQPERVQQAFMAGRSLGLFGPDSKRRWQCLQLVTWKYFDYIIFFFVLCSSVTLAIESPGLDPAISKVLRYLDIVWVTVFITEAVLKVLAFGLVFNGRGSYLRDGWNVMDFIIVLSSIVLLVLEYGVRVEDDNHDQVQMLRVLRTLRALRPLRFASSSEQLKVVISALFSSLASLVHVGVVCLLFYLLFGILGVNLLKGAMHYCQDVATGEVVDAYNVLPAGGAINSSWCGHGAVHSVATSDYLSRLGLSLPQPYNITTSWTKPAINFDHMGSSVLALFQVATLELWISTMYSAVNAVGPERQPVQGHNPAISIYFVTFLVIGSFLVLNLLVAITIEKFSEHHSRNLGYNLFLTPQQQAWVDVQRLLMVTKPEVTYNRPAERWCSAVFDVVVSNAFHHFMYGVILLNVGFLTLVHVDMGDTWQALNTYSDLGFTVIFVVEVVAIFAALGPKQFLRDAWMVLLLIIALTSTASVVLDLVGRAPYFLAPLLRVVRVTRFIKIFASADGLQRLIRTLVHSLPAIVNVGSVMLLFFFVWAVLGMNLFGSVRHGDYLTRHSDFHNWPAAMMTLFRQLTGENWNGIMADCMVTTDCVLVMQSTLSPATNATLLAGEYYSHKAAELRGVPAELLEDQCSPGPLLAVLFFLSFELLCAFIIINIVVAIILEGMINDEADELLPVPRNNVMQFVKVWSQLDPPASGYIPTHRLPELVMELDPPLGVKGGTTNSRLGVQDVVLSADIPNRTGNRVHFLEVLHALCGRVCGAELPDMTEDKIYNRLTKRLPEGRNASRTFNDVKYTSAHYHAAIHVRAAVKGFLTRHQLQGELAAFHATLREMEQQQQQRQPQQQAGSSLLQHQDHLQHRRSDEEDMAMAPMASPISVDASAKAAAPSNSPPEGLAAGGDGDGHLRRGTTESLSGTGGGGVAGSSYASGVSGSGLQSALQQQLQQQLSRQRSTATAAGATGGGHNTITSGSGAADGGSGGGGGAVSGDGYSGDAAAIVVPVVTRPRSFVLAAQQLIKGEAPPPSGDHGHGHGNGWRSCGAAAAATGAAAAGGGDGAATKARRYSLSPQAASALTQALRRHAEGMGRPGEAAPMRAVPAAPAAAAASDSDGGSAGPTHTMVMRGALGRVRWLMSASGKPGDKPAIKGNSVAPAALPSEDSATQPPPRKGVAAPGGAAPTVAKGLLLPPAATAATASVTSMIAVAFEDEDEPAATAAAVAAATASSSSPGGGGTAGVQAEADGANAGAGVAIAGPRRSSSGAGDGAAPSAAAAPTAAAPPLAPAAAAATAASMAAPAEAADAAASTEPKEVVAEERQPSHGTNGTLASEQHSAEATARTQP